MNMIIVAILAVRFLIKLHFPANTPISTIPPKVSNKKSFHRRKTNLKDVRILLIYTFVDLQNTETSVREGLWC